MDKWVADHWESWKQAKFFEASGIVGTTLAIVMKPENILLRSLCVCLFFVWLLWFLNFCFGTLNAIHRGDWKVEGVAKALKKLFFYAVVVCVGFGFMWLGSQFPVAGFNPLTALAGSLVTLISLIEGVSGLAEAAEWTGNERLVKLFGGVKVRGENLANRLAEIDPASDAALKEVQRRTDEQDQRLLLQRRDLEDAQRKILRLEARESKLVVDVNRQLARKGVRIILIDDDHDYLNLLKLHFEAYEHIIKPLLDGHNVVEEVLEFKPDLVVTDLLQIDMHGAEIADTLREDPRTREVPVVAITGLNLQSAERRVFSHLLSSNFAGVIQKPMDDYERFIAEILTYCEGSSTV